MPAEAKGIRLDLFLAQVEPGLSRTRLKSLLESGEATVDGALAPPSRRLKGGERIELSIGEPKAVALEPQPMSLKILFEDSELIAVDKRAGLVVHPGAGNADGTLVNALLAHCGDLAGIGGELRPGIVHRLDKETSGCIIIAKTERALLSLQAQLKERTVEKSYLALAHGALAGSGRFETLHGRHPIHRKRFTSKVTSGKSAITEWCVEKEFGCATLLRLKLITGRTHQIRVHLSEAGHPLVHDELYGGVARERRLADEAPLAAAARLIGRQALHAERFTFSHPVSGARLVLHAPLPADFEAALARLSQCT